MSLEVNIILGNKSSICRNDAYAIVDNRQDGSTLLDIIPEYEIGAGKSSQILKAFENASLATSAQDVKALARQALGLTQYPVPQAFS